MFWLDFLNGCINLDLNFFFNFRLFSIYYSGNLRNSIKRIVLDWLIILDCFNFKYKIFMRIFLGVLYVFWYKRGRIYLFLKRKLYVYCI